jgi:hypothetical protein
VSLSDDNKRVIDYAFHAGMLGAVLRGVLERGTDADVALARVVLKNYDEWSRALWEGTQTKTVEGHRLHLVNDTRPVHTLSGHEESSQACRYPYDTDSPCLVNADGSTSCGGRACPKCGRDLRGGGECEVHPAATGSRA